MDRTLQQSLIKHTPHSLIIEIPTADAAATHAALIQGIASGIKGHLTSSENTPQDVNYIVSLLELLKNVLPTEDKMEQAYRNRQ